MKHALIIARRDLVTLFRSPLAYVFLTVFLLLAQVPFVLLVIPVGLADLRPVFASLPVFVTVFAALVTMRSWAEERQENTYEMLLTFPVKDRELVLGKFLGALSFLAVGLLATTTLPIMLFRLGEPDVGPMLTGYLGALLVAAMWSSIGLFFSSLTRSQLLAALATLIAAFPSIAFGTDLCRTLVDAATGNPGLTHSLDQMFGTFGHYDSFAKGVVELSDVAYYVGWTGVFLYLNTLWITLRRHPQGATVLAAGTVLLLGCGALFGRLTSDSTWARQDFTAEKLYTLSQGTVRILSRAKVPVRVTLYISPDEEMPTDYKRLESDITDRLRELQVATGGKLTFQVEHKKAGETYEALASADGEEPLEIGADDDKPVDPKKPEDAAKTEQRRKEKRLLDKGIRPFMVQSLQATESSTKLIYATLGIAYREKDEELVQPLGPERLQDLEYLIANTVSRLTRDRPPRIALHVGKEPMDPQLVQMYRQMGRDIPEPYSQVEAFLRRERYDVVRAGFTAYDGMPEDYDALVVMGPTELDERAQWEINRALVSGKPTFLAVQRYTWAYEQRERSLRATRTDAQPNVDTVLAAQGLGVSTEVLMDEEHEALLVRTGGIQDLMGGAPLKVPTHIHVKSGSLNAESPLTQRVSSIFYLWGTPITLDAGKVAGAGLHSTVLYQSSPNSAAVDPLTKGFALSLRGRTMSRYPLAADVTGQFTDAFPGKPRPKWKFQLEMTPDGRPRPVPPDAPEQPMTAAPGRLILTGCARTWQNGLVDKLGNGAFLLNALDALTLDEDILAVRSKQPMPRRFDAPTAGAAFLFRAVPLGLVPMLILALGIGVWMLRLRRRETWARSHGR